MADTLTAPVIEAPVAPVPAAPSPAPAPSLDVKSNPFSALDAKARALPAKVEPAKEPPKEGATDQPAKPDPAKPTPSKEDRTAKDPKWFREQHEKSQNELKASADRIRSMEARIADFEARGKDVTVLTERLAKLEQERDGLRGELRASKQEPSEEFQKQFVKPFNNAAAYASSMITQLSIATEDGGARSATWNDFTALFSMPINKAAAAARQQFGDDAPLVIGQLTELHRLDHLRNAALEEEKANWKVNSEKEHAQRVQSEQGYKAMVSELDKHFAENNPDFKDAPGDEGKEGRELRQGGYELFDQKPKTIQEAATRSAYVRHIVGAHYPLIRERDGLRGKVKELESTIAELRKNKPGPSERITKEAGGAEPGDSWADDLRKNVTAS